MPFASRPFLLFALTSLALVLASSRARAQDDWAHPAVDDAPPPAPPPPLADTSDDARHDTVVLVHVDAPQTVELQRRGVLGRWDTVCRSPCDLALAERRTYRIDAAGIRASDSFSLQGLGDRVTLVVRPASNGWFAVGIVAGSVGVSALATGALVYLVIAPLQGLSNALGSREGSESSTSTAGTAMMLVGAAALVAGIVVLLASPSTGVTMPGGAFPRAARERVTFANDAASAAAPSPTAKDAPRWEAQLPRPAALSVLTLRF